MMDRKNLGEYVVRAVRAYEYDSLKRDSYTKVYSLDTKVKHELVLENTNGDRRIIKINDGYLLEGDKVIVGYSERFDLYYLKDVRTGNEIR